MAGSYFKARNPPWYTHTISGTNPSDDWTSQDWHDTAGTGQYEDAQEKVSRQILNHWYVQYCMLYHPRPQQCWWSSVCLRRVYSLFPLVRLICLHVWFCADTQREQSGSQRDEGTCPSWIRDFQLDYLKHGINNTEVQKQYLQKLAEEYHDKYKKDEKCVDALKVKIIMRWILKYSFCKQNL